MRSTNSTAVKTWLRFCWHMGRYVHTGSVLCDPHLGVHTSRISLMLQCCPHDIPCMNVELERTFSTPQRSNVETFATYDPSLSSTSRVHCTDDSDSFGVSAPSCVVMSCKSPMVIHAWGSLFFSLWKALLTMTRERLSFILWYWRQKKRPWTPRTYSELSRPPVDLPLRSPHLLVHVPLLGLHVFCFGLALPP